MYSTLRNNPRDYVTVVLEGNIGSGKTAVLEALKRKHPEYTYIHEPLDAFCSFEKQDGTTLNPLQMFYANPENAIITQLYFLDIYHKRVKDIETRDDLSKIIICDRWISSCRIFTDALRKCNHISAFAWEYFTRKYNETAKTLDFITPNAIYYVDTPVDVCLERQKLRGREMEVNFIEMKTYLHELNICYDQMLNDIPSKYHIQKSSGISITERVEEIEQLISSMDIVRT